MFPSTFHNWRMDMPATLKPRKGRGAGTNESGRFESEKRVPFDDGWGSSEAEPARLPTTLSVDTTRTIIARNDSPDIGFDRSINPYRGCEHGCIYCYARPSHAYLGLSPGLDFETRIFYKPQAAALLKAELCKKGYNCRPLALGSNTDPYQPAEKRLGITVFRLPLEVKALFREWLEEHEPQKSSHVLSLVAQCHGGRLYDSAWSKRTTGDGPYAEMLAARFDRACRRLGFGPRLNYPLDTTLFRPPPQKGDQLALF